MIMKYVGSCTDSALDYSSSWDQALPAPRTCTENCVIHFIYCAGLTTRGTHEARPQYSISFPLGLMLLYVRNNCLYIVTPGGEQIKSRSKVLKKILTKDRIDWTQAVWTLNTTLLMNSAHNSSQEVFVICFTTVCVFLIHMIHAAAS